MKLAFGSKARSGKDTAAEYLTSLYGGTSFKFASAIYDISRYAYTRAGLPFEKNAKLLQFLGTDFGRSIDKDIWVKSCLADIQRFEDVNSVENIFVTDCRFENEADALKQSGFVLVQIDRSADLRGDIGRDPNHPSEIALDHYTRWDYTIGNNGTLEEFHNKIHTLYLQLLDSSPQ